jgi:WD40 repeat protein
MHDPVTGIVTHSMVGYLGKAPPRTFSASGLVLASGFVDGSLELVDLVGRKIKHRLTGPKSVESIGISADGELLAWMCLGDNIIRLWDTTKGASGALDRQIETKETLQSSRLTFSPDSQMLAVKTNDSIHLFDVTAGRLKFELSNSQLQPSSSRFERHHEIAFSSDSSLLVISGGTKRLTVWDCVTGSRKFVYERPVISVLPAALAPNSPEMVIGGEDGVVRLWDLAMLQALNRESTQMDNMILLPDRSWLASKTAEQLRIWDTSTGVCKHTIINHREKISQRRSTYGLISAMAFSHDSRLMALMDVTRAEISLWDAKTCTRKRTLRSSLYFLSVLQSPSPTPSLCLAFARNGLLASSVNDTVILWDSRTCAQLQHWKVDEKVTKLEFFDDGPSPETNLNPRKAGDEIHLRTNFGFLGPGNNVFSQNSLYVKLKASANSGRVRKALNSLGIKTGERKTIQSLTPNEEDERPGISSLYEAKPFDVSLGSNHWITLNGKRAIWLPSEFRPQSYEIMWRNNDGIIALGLRSGQVYFIGFRI